MEEAMQALMQEVVEQIKLPKKTDKTAAINSLRRIADPAATLALTIEASIKLHQTKLSHFAYGRRFWDTRSHGTTILA